MRGAILAAAFVTVACGSETPRPVGNREGIEFERAPPVSPRDRLELASPPADRPEDVARHTARGIQFEPPVSRRDAGARENPDASRPSLDAGDASDAGRSRDSGDDGASRDVDVADAEVARDARDGQSIDAGLVDASPSRLADAASNG